MRLTSHRDVDDPERCNQRGDKRFSRAIRLILDTDVWNFLVKVSVTCGGLSYLSFTALVVRLNGGNSIGLVRIIAEPDVVDFLAPRPCNRKTIVVSIFLSHCRFLLYRINRNSTIICSTSDQQ